LTPAARIAGLIEVMLPQERVAAREAANVQLVTG
jgi:hypothetical protein